MEYEKIEDLILAKIEEMDEKEKKQLATLFLIMKSFHDDIATRLDKMESTLRPELIVDDPEAKEILLGCLQKEKDAGRKEIDIIVLHEMTKLPFEQITRIMKQIIPDDEDE